MNEIDLLKRVRDDVPPPAPIALARARQRLVTEHPVRRPSVARRRVLVAGTLAATLAAAFLVNDVVTRDGGTTPGAVADAGTFLASAAALTSASPDAPIPPGQYRQISQRTQGTWNFGPSNKFHGTRLDVSDWWVSADQNPPYTVIAVTAKREFSSPAAKAFWAKADPLNVKPRPVKSDQVCGVGTNGGSLVLQRKDGKNFCSPSWFTPSADFFAKLPRDPEALLTELRKDDPTLPEPNLTAEQIDRRAFDRVSTILASGIAPADLRAAVYEAAGHIPGIKLQTDAVNLDGQSGRAITQMQLFGIRKELIIAPKTGQFLGIREVATVTGPPNFDGDPMPINRGDILNWTSVTTKITPTRPTVH